LGSSKDLSAGGKKFNRGDRGTGRRLMPP
jgi:hypothetical protein